MCESFHPAARVSEKQQKPVILQKTIKRWKGMGMSFISYLINGLSLGSVYAIIALGYTMVYGIAKMLNFAH